MGLMKIFIIGMLITVALFIWVDYYSGEPISFKSGVEDSDWTLKNQFYPEYKLLLNCESEIPIVLEYENYSINKTMEEYCDVLK